MNSPTHLACLLLLSLTAQAQADELGRLFFTPDERRQLERQQAHQARHAGNDDPSAITVNGVIRRSDGNRIVWINGKAQHIAPSRDPDKVPVTVPGKSKPVEVKVGQRLLLNNSSPPGTAKDAE